MIAYGNAQPVRGVLAADREKERPNNEYGDDEVGYCL